MFNSENWDAVVTELATRPGHEKVRALLYRILVNGLRVNSQDIHFEMRLPEVHGRADALLGRTVIEFKSDLRRERKEAEKGLARYLKDREQHSGEKYVGIATDGAKFIAYFVKDYGVVEVAEHKTDPEKPHALLEWLETAISVSAEIAPEPEVVIREFGRSSLAARRALDELDALWHGVRGKPEARLKRQLWTSLLSLAYGTDVGNETLFLQHTYLVVVAKAMAWIAMIGEEPEDAEGLLHGRAFGDLGIAGQNEPDFFDWILRTRDGPDLVMRIARQVSRLRLRDIRTDILKALYESLIDPDTRHDLGEYYTPDWLAIRIVSTVVDEPLEQRVMDPACGSGTFLFHAVRRVLEAADEAGFSKAEGVRRAVEKVAGIDVHPVAVIFARVTYLLAIVPALREDHPGDLAIPVYLGDALQWNRIRVAHDAEQPDLLADDGTLEISIPAARITKPKVGTLSAATLRFPAALASEAQVFDLVVRTMIALAARDEDEGNFSAWMEHQGSISPGDRKVLRTSYKVMRRLQKEGRNHIWGYVARNLARPVWLSSEPQKVDVVIGNPPWVSYRFMDAKFQERFRSECRRTSLWVGAQVATQQDLSSYFYMRAAVLYMRKTGTIALVMPYAAMSRKAYAGFRKGEISDNGNVEMRLRFTRGWTFGPKVQPLFPVPCCVLFAKAHGSGEPAKLPTQVQEFRGTLPKRNATEAEARKALNEEQAGWPKEATDKGGSVYRATFRNGAALWPRRLVLVERESSTGNRPPNPHAPVVRGRVGSHDKEPWTRVRPPIGAIEKRFLYPIHLGETIVPFRALRALEAVVPWDEGKQELMDAEEAAQRGYRQLAQWLEKSEALWNRHQRDDKSLQEQIDYYGKLSKQFPIERLRVVYTKSGKNLVAALIEDNTAIIDHKLFWAPARSRDEGLFLCGILNSDAIRTKVREYQSQGQFGARDFDKYIFNIGIPRFERGEKLHRALASAAKTATKVAEGVEIDETADFKTTRKRIRDALGEHGIAERLEELANSLLKGK